jgi:uncharacterized membrane protein YkvA (DUF1232 family)
MSMNDSTQPEPPAPPTTTGVGSLPSLLVDEQGQPRSSEIRQALEEFWTGVKRLPAYIKLAAAMGRDERVPKSAKAFLVTGGVYTVSPIDLVPGIIPVAGQLDDLYVILTAIQQAIRVTPKPIADEYLAKYNVTRDDIEHDLAAVRNLVKQAAIVTAKFGMRTIRQTGSRIRRLAEQYTQRGGASRDDKPI